MKAWKKAMILSAICAGILVSPWIATQIQNGTLPANQLPQLPAHEFTDAEIQVLTSWAHNQAGRGEVREDVATGFSLGTAPTSDYAIRVGGTICGTTPSQIALAIELDGSAPLLVRQHDHVTATGFISGTRLDQKNAVIDAAHECIIIMNFDGTVTAVVVIGFAEA